MKARSWRLRSLAVVAMLALVSTGCAWVQRVSVDSAGNQANADAFSRSISADGRYVVFVSYASNLVAGDTNDAFDVFVRDTVTSTTTRVSVSTAGNQSNAASFSAAISADGRYVAFYTDASNLVAGDTNNQQDVFVRDRVAATTTRVSVDRAGAQANSSSAVPAISADGRYVAFLSYASNLVAGDTNDAGDVFVRDTVAGTTTRVDVAGAGTQANADSTDSPALSADGRYVTYLSYASNLVAGDTNGKRDVFVRDTVAGTTARVNVAGGGAQANDDAFDPAISANGRYVGFSTAASNLVPGDTFSSSNVFVRDRVAGTTTQVDVDSAGTPGNLDIVISPPAISADGRYIAFASFARNLVAGDTNNASDVFVRDTVAATTTRVSVDTVGREGNDNSELPSISGDGRYVVFQSLATNLVPDDTNGVQDVVVRANPEPTVTGVAPSTLSRGAATTVRITGSGFIPGARVLIDGADRTITNVTVVSPTKITARVTFNADAALTARNVWVQLPGTGPGPGAGAFGVCGSCVTVS